MGHQVFISYAAEDKTIADAVCETIESHGIKCWIAPRDVSYGEDFEESIVDAISASRLFVLILTQHSNTSKHVKREVQNAGMDEVGIPVLPFRVEDVPLNKALKYYIGSVHWLDAVTPPIESHLKQLVEHITARLPPPPEVETVAAEPSAPTVDSARPGTLDPSANAVIADDDLKPASELLEESEPPPEVPSPTIDAPEVIAPTPLSEAAPEVFQSDATVTQAPTRRATTMDWIGITIFAISGAVLFLIGSIVIIRMLAALNLDILNPGEVVVRDSAVGFFLAITVRELFQSPRWSVEQSRRPIAFVVHGAAGAVLATALTALASLYDAVMYLLHPSPYLPDTPRMRVTSILRFYERADTYLPAIIAGVVVGAIICLIRIRRQEKPSHQPLKRPKFTLLFPFAGALILGAMGNHPAIPHYMMLTTRDALFGLFLGVAISEMHPAAMWAVREGEKLRAYFAYASTAAAIAMLYSGAVLSKLSDFYPAYLEFYFTNPMRLAFFGFLIGSVLFSAKIIYRPTRTMTSSTS